jgi:hypothetical protein
MKIMFWTWKLWLANGIGVYTFYFYSRAGNKHWKTSTGKQALENKQWKTSTGKQALENKHWKTSTGKHALWR